MKRITLEGEDGKTPRNDQDRLADKEFIFVRVHILFVLCGRYLTNRARVVYMTLASYAGNESRRCFPSLPELEERSGLSHSTVGKALNELEHFDYIRRASKCEWSSKHKKYVKKNYFWLCLPPTKLKPTRKEAKQYASECKERDPDKRNKMIIQNMIDDFSDEERGWRMELASDTRVSGN